MGITDAFDVLVKNRQQNCFHPYQDRVATPTKIFCGKCGKEEENDSS